MPKVIFKKMSLENNIDIVKWTFYDESDSMDFKKFTIECFPELGEVDSLKLSREEVYKAIEGIVKKKYEEESDFLDNEVKRYNKAWEKYNDKFFQNLCEYLKIEWPKGKEIIEGEIGIIPVFPRFLDEFCFALGEGLDEQKIIEVTSHETTHFAWFTKWKTLYPNCPRREYDSPYIPWKYSEMVVDPILNSELLQNAFAGLFKERAYDYFYDMEYDGKRVMEELNNIFLRNLLIEEKIKIGYEYINKVFSVK